MRQKKPFNKENLLNHKIYDKIPVLKEGLLLEENGDIYETH